jgi:hypothetical protein
VEPTTTTAIGASFLSHPKPQKVERTIVPDGPRRFNIAMGWTRGLDRDKDGIAREKA